MKIIREGSYEKITGEKIKEGITKGIMESLSKVSIKV